MAEENTPPQGGDNPPPKGGDGKPSTGDPFTPITSQEQLNRLIGERINAVKSQYADYNALKEKAAKFDEAENKNKTELQRATEERDAAIAERDRLRHTQLQLDVGTAKGLTPAQAKRLVGSTKEELEADADAFKADLGETGGKPTPPKPNPAQGRERETPKSGDWLRDQLTRG